MTETKLRVVPCPVDGDGCWAVREGDEDGYGYLAGGFPDKAEAQEWLKNELLERQCLERECYVAQDENDEKYTFF
jgi:hypothetical protein